MRCEAQLRIEAIRTDVYVEREPEVATKQIAKRESPESISEIAGRNVDDREITEVVLLINDYPP